VGDITVISKLYDGSPKRTWTADLVRIDGSAVELVGKFDADVNHSELGLIRAGTVSYEYFWLDRWYNVFVFFKPDGTLRNLYANITLPPTLSTSDNILEYVDLDIDILEWPDGRRAVLDEDEFYQHARKFRYPANVVQNTHATLDYLLQLRSLVPAER
jgi:uncharacterized protein